MPIFLLSDRKVVRQIALFTKVRPITRHSRLLEDLKIDFDQRQALVRNLEELFDMKIRDSAHSWLTVKDFQFGITRLCKER